MIMSRMIGCFPPGPQFILCASNASAANASCADKQLNINIPTPLGYLISKISMAFLVCYLGQFSGNE
jgi:hypothetical protein